MKATANADVTAAAAAAMTTVLVVVAEATDQVGIKYTLVAPLSLLHRCQCNT